MMQQHHDPAVSDSIAYTSPEVKPFIEKTYDYRDEYAALLYQVCRFVPKTFRQRRRCPFTGDWLWSLGDTRRVLYRLPELIRSSIDDPVIIAEGEKDVDLLWSLGYIATTSVGGAGKWKTEYNDHLNGRDVIIIPDNDTPGKEHANHVAELLFGVSPSIKILNLPDLPLHGDVTDFITLHGPDAFAQALKKSKEWQRPLSPFFPEGVRPKNTRVYGGKAELHQLKMNADIVSFFNKRLKFGRKSGPDRLMYHCNQHGEDRTPSLCVWPDQGTYRCFGCARGGDIITAMEIFDRLSFVDAVRILAEECHVKNPLE